MHANVDLASSVAITTKLTCCSTFQTFTSFPVTNPGQFKGHFSEFQNITEYYV